jgi:hypothetical protein
MTDEQRKELRAKCEAALVDKDIIDRAERNQNTRIGKGYFTDWELAEASWRPALAQFLVALFSPATVLALLDERDELAAKLERAEAALREIDDPIAFMRIRAKQSGGTLDGAMAVALSDDALFLRAIARTYLNPPQEKPK